MHGFSPILAEVADKEPTLTALWGLAAVFCFGGFILCRWRRAASIVVVPIVALWALAVISELRDGNVGPAILSELGKGYVLQAYIAVLIPFAFVCVALCVRTRKVQPAASP